MNRYLLCLGVLVVSQAGARADDVEALKKGLAKGGNPADARAAWERLVVVGPAALPALLRGMDTPDTVLANWLSTAFDRIVEIEVKSGGKTIDIDALIAFAKDEKRQGRARRLALETAERLRPGTRDTLTQGWLNDPEFRFDAVALTMKKFDAIENPRAKAAAFRGLFEATRDVGQAKTIAAKLKELGEPVSVSDHLGFPRDWYVIGPFDAAGMKGFKTVYPPEENLDLKGEYDGKGKKVRWKRFTVAEPVPTAFNEKGLIVSVREPLGDADDAVAYAHTAFKVDAEKTVEFRGAADDHFIVWVNGERVFGFEEYRNGVRFDRHRFKVKLRTGVNTVLVKVGQSPRDPTNPEPNWEFLLRVVDESGKGVTFPGALPE